MPGRRPRISREKQVGISSGTLPIRGEKVFAGTEIPPEVINVPLDNPNFTVQEILFNGDIKNTPAGTVGNLTVLTADNINQESITCFSSGVSNNFIRLKLKEFKAGSVDFEVFQNGWGVKATGTITTPGGANLMDGETFTIDDGSNPAHVFQFVSGTGVLTSGDTAVAFTPADSASTVRDSIVSAVDGVGAALEVDAAPYGGGGQVNLTNDRPGTAGNVPITDNVADVGFTTTGMAGGALGDPIGCSIYALK